MNIDLNPVYDMPRQQEKYISGICTAIIFTNDDEQEEVEISYEGVDHGCGEYDIYVTRPSVANASDLYTDVVDALYADGVPAIKKLEWL